MRLAAAALAIVLLAGSALAQAASEPQKIKGMIASFAAPVLTVKTAKGDSLAITLAPEARIMGNEKSEFASIKTGDFIASTSAAGKDGRLQAQELRLFPESLRGLGEGQYPYDNGSKSLTNGTVTTAAGAVKTKGGVLKLSFHGSTPGPNGMCSGHAPAPGQGPCTGETEITVSPKTPVTAWVIGDQTWLEPGNAVSLFAVTDGAGKSVTYGVLVEHNGVKPLP